MPDDIGSHPQPAKPATAAPAAPAVSHNGARRKRMLKILAAVVVGGLMGQNVLDAKGVANLATLPSLDQLRGKIVGLLQAPATKIAGVLQAPAGQLARVFGAYANKDAA